MDLRDYVLMLRRGWLLIAGVTAAGLLLGVAFLHATTEVYESTSVILAAPNDPVTMSDLQLGAQFATSSGPTIATLITSSQVLDPVAKSFATDSFSPDTAELGSSQLAGLLSVSAAESTSVIYVTASAASSEEAATIANAVADSAVRVIPRLVAANPQIPPRLCWTSGSFSRAPSQTFR